LIEEVSAHKLPASKKEQRPMETTKHIAISNPGIGGSGFLTLAAMEADAGIHAGYHVAVHQCRGLAQAGGPLCMDVVIQDQEVVGSVAHNIDYINSSDMMEAWRCLTSVEDIRKCFPHGITVVTDYFVDVPILIMGRKRGPRYPAEDEFIKKFGELIERCENLRVVVYDFAKHSFPAILKGPFSYGVIVADLEERKEDWLLKIPVQHAIAGILANVPKQKDEDANIHRQKFNRHVFERGYQARKQYTGSKTSRIIMI